ncbi:hypothetical protein B0H11DRAFT_2070793 [Mycena galericulata]|nr:hypothetical protein B0H11DRAFT_2070793 [Mycena galericulata]
MDGSSRHCIAYVTLFGACAASGFLPFTLFPRPPRAKRSPSPLQRPAVEPARLPTAPRPPRCVCPAFLSPPLPLRRIARLSRARTLAGLSQQPSRSLIGFLHLGAFRTLVVPPRQFGTCCPLVSPSPAPLSPLVPSHPLHLSRSIRPALPRLRSRAGSVPVPPLRRVAYLPPPSHGHSALSLKICVPYPLYPPACCVPFPSPFLPSNIASSAFCTRKLTEPHLSRRLLSWMHHAVRLFK